MPITRFLVGSSGSLLPLKETSSSTTSKPPALRRFGADGQYLGTLGRSGSGPGEYANSDGGLAVLRDGRILLRDPGNARLTVYAPDGGHQGSWPLQRGGYTSTPIVAAADGGFYNPVWGGPTSAYGAIYGGGHTS